MARNLTFQQRAFVVEFVKDENGTEAAKRAGYSERSAHVQASRLLKDDKVLAAIEVQLKAQEIRHLATPDRIIAEMARISFADTRTLYDAEGNILPPSKWPDDIAAAIAGVEVDELKDDNGAVIGYTKKVKLWDKGKALENLAKHLRLLVNVSEVSGKNGGPIETKPSSLFDLSGADNAKIDALLGRIDALIAAKR